jgi:hypothetical protein
LFVQAFLGLPALSAGAGFAIGLAGALLWLSAFAYAGWMRVSAPALVAAQ